MRRGKPFISFSGERSELIGGAVARLISDIWDERTFFSRNIRAGAKIPKKLRENLSRATCGVICITAENRLNPWIIYEAAALSMNGGRVFELLIDDNIAGTRMPLPDPLELFLQRTVSIGKEDVWGLLVEVARLRDWRRGPEQRALFNQHWDSFDKIVEVVTKTRWTAPRSMFEIHAKAWKIQAQKKRSFCRFLRDSLLERTDIALEELTRDSNWDTTFSEYRGQIVTKLASELKKAVLVLAVCSDKANREETLSYFDEFYKWAKGGPPLGLSGDDPRVHRLFVERSSGYGATDQQALTDHVNSPRVRAYRLLSGNLPTIRRYPGFQEEIEDGLGFILFVSREGSTTAFIHQGTGSDLQFCKLEDRATSRRLLDIWFLLAANTEECRSKSQIKEVKELQQKAREWSSK